MPGKGLAPYGIRHSGEGVKGKGYFGKLPVDGGYATELSAEDDFGEYPLLVPGLTKEEMDALLKGEKPSERVQNVARKHAEQRKASGKGAFASPNELKYPIPEMKKGGKVSSASKRADGCAIKGKTRGRIV